MKRVFQPLGFIVDVRNDLTKSEMKQVLKEYQKKEHGHCFIIIILSHGRYGVVYSSDDKKISITDEIAQKFQKKKCPSLEGKPCIFIVDAFGSSKKNISATKQECTKMRKQSASEIQNEATDIAIMYAKTQDDPLYFTEYEGNLFTKWFENVVNKGIRKQTMFNIIMPEVQNCLSRFTGNPQSVEIVSRLRNLCMTLQVVSVY